MEYYTILTEQGKQKILNASNGGKINLTKIILGDSNGQYYEPNSSQTSLKNKIWEGDITNISTDNNPSWIRLETTIPSTAGGFYIRELGIVDDTGTLIAVGKYPQTYKPTIEDGSIKELYINVIIQVSDTNSINLTVNDNIVSVTKKEFNDRLSELKFKELEVEESKNIDNLFGGEILIKNVKGRSCKGNLLKNTINSINILSPTDNHFNTYYCDDTIPSCGKVIAGKQTYTLSFVLEQKGENPFSSIIIGKKDGDAWSYRLYPKDFKVTNISGNKSKYVCTFTIDGDKGEYINDSIIFICETWDKNVNSIVANTQLEEGDKATSWKPNNNTWSAGETEDSNTGIIITTTDQLKQQKSTLIIPTVLRQLGDVCDEIIENKIIRRINAINPKDQSSWTLFNPPKIENLSETYKIHGYPNGTIEVDNIVKANMTIEYPNSVCAGIYTNSNSLEDLRLDIRKQQDNINLNTAKIGNLENRIDKIDVDIALLKGQGASNIFLEKFTNLDDVDLVSGIWDKKNKRVVI